MKKPPLPVSLKLTMSPSQSVQPSKTTDTVDDKIKIAQELLDQGSDAFLAAVDAANIASSILDADPTGIAKAVFCLVKVVMTKIQEVKGNKAQLNYISKRIGLVFPPLIRLKEDTKASSQMKLPLLSFKDCLEDCYAQAQKYAQTGWFKKIIMSGADTQRFESLVVRLNDNIAQLDLTLAVEQTVLLETISRCQTEDKDFIMANMQTIIKLEEESMREVKALRKQQQQFNIEQKEFNDILGRQLEAIPLAMAEKLKLTALEQQSFFETQFSWLNKQFSQLNAPTSGKIKSKPSISSHLTIAFYDLLIDQIIQKGSFATIYKGEWCGIPVAIKKVGNRLQGDDFKQFINEVMNMAKLHHPNVVQVYGACLEPEACMVMEYVEQGSLVQLLAEKKVSLSQRAQIAVDLGNAIRYLHDLGGMHRDLNPGDVLIDASFRAKLSDFGLAKSLSNKVSTVEGIHQNQRRNSGARIHLEWLPPELMQRNAKATQASDIYSLGLTLYYLFAGESLFESIVAENIAMAVKLGENRDKIDKKIPEVYRDLIRSTLQVNPELRPEARDLSEQLARLKLEISSGAVLTRGGEIRQIGTLSPNSIHNEGNKYAREGQHQQAYECYLRAAKAGYFRAQTDLGVVLLQGIGCQQDKKSAFDWLLKAAHQKHARAQFNIAMMLQYGDGVPQNKGQALFWYQQAAAQGHQQANEKVNELKKVTNSEAPSSPSFK